MVDSIAENKYSAFLVNRALSQFPDTVIYANEMNLNHHLDPKLQYSFFINIIRKKKRFSKWAKPSVQEDLDVIKEYYGYSTEKAKSVLSLLTSDQIDDLRKRIYKGGKE